MISLLCAGTLEYTRTSLTGLSLRRWSEAQRSKVWGRADQLEGPRSRVPHQRTSSDCQRKRWPQEVLRADCRVHEDRVPCEACWRLRDCCTDELQHFKAWGWTEQIEGVLSQQEGGPKRLLRHHKLYEQLAECKKPKAHEDSDDGTKTAALVMSNTSKPANRTNRRSTLTARWRTRVATTSPQTRTSTARRRG